MTELQIILDTTMCCLWVLTYTIVLIGTIKYKYPLISPITQAIIAPFEFAVLYCYIINGYLGLNYVSLAYIYWTFIELAIIYVMIKSNFIPKKKVAAYLTILCVLTCLMCYLVGHKEQTFFFSYFNTFIGELIWLYHIHRKKYPMKPLSLIAFMAKFIGDAISIPVYFGIGSWLINFICVSLPILDLVFIVINFLRRKIAYSMASTP